jgi:chromate transporter
MEEPLAHFDRHIPSLSRLFNAFFRLGTTAFGGPAMIAYIRKMAVGQKQWLDSDSFQDGIALCQAIPGATAMQMAAYVGLKAGGVRGAMASYIGFGLPAFLLMLGLSFMYARAHGLPAVISAFSGLQAIIVAIVANASVSFGKNALKNWKSVFIAIVSAGLFGLMVNPVSIILLAAILGMGLHGEQPGPGPSHPGMGKSPVLPLLVVVSFSAAGFACLLFFRKELFDLAALMSKIDLIAFGGGFASVPLMFHEIVEVRSWINGPTFLNGIILGQFTPGPIVITATFVGYLLHGFPGALVATIAIFLPSFLMVIAVAPWFERIRLFPWFAKAIKGTSDSFVGLLLAVTVRFGMHIHWDWAHTALAIAAFTALILKTDILWVVLGGTVLSVLIF